MQRLKYLIVTLLVAVAFIGGFFTHKKIAKPIIQTDYQTDTVIKWQTVSVDRPVLIKERVTDTMTVYVDSSKVTHRQDSAFLTLPKTTKEYSNEYYTLAVSGFQPTLDYIKLSIPTKVVREQPKLNHLTVTASAVYLGRIYTPILAKYEYGKDLRIGGSIGYDIIRRYPVLAVHGSYSFGW